MSKKMNDKVIAFILTSSDDRKVIIPRVIVGLVFLTEGIQKFLFPDLLGPGRFEKIGFSDPAFWACFTGIFEIVCGSAVLLGFLTRIASIPLLIIMITAFFTTKWPLLLSKGFWVFAHEYRTDFAMTLLLIYLLISNGGKWTLNEVLFRSS
jgi:putative oxidoreductase